MGDLAKAIRQIVTELDQTGPVTNVMPIEEVLTESFGRNAILHAASQRFCRGCLIPSGDRHLWRDVPYFVSQRTHDIGIRIVCRSTPVRHLQLVRTWSEAGVDRNRRRSSIGVGIDAFEFAAVLFGVKSTRSADLPCHGADTGCRRFPRVLHSARAQLKVDPLVGTLLGECRP